MDEDNQNQDICRVCRCEGTNDRQLFHPCICTGSIKFIHQDCLVQWLRYSRKEYCELCKHRFSFTPIYSPDMPGRLPIGDILSGLARSMGTAVRYWLHYTLVAVAWLGVVPLSACRIYRSLFTGSVSSLFTLPLDLLSTENLLSDIFHGCVVVIWTLSAFISLVWLREQILHGGGPDWLEQDLQNEPEPAPNLPNEEALGIQNGEREEGEAGNLVPAAQANNNEEMLHEGQAVAVANNNNNNNDNNQDAGADDINWNPIEWDRAADELTWERLLGLDGSLVFLEHVFWVVSLNTMFIVVFAFCPYHIGHFAVQELNLKDFVEASHFEGLLTALCGYCVVAVISLVLHTMASLTRFNKSKRILGLGYVVVKVALLSVLEIGVFPLVGGWWLDICSLALFDATLKDRDANFRFAPGTSVFIHWLVGMVYVFYFASFILLLREVLRPGVLWFLRNLNDPDFNPVQEMIHLPIIRHTRRFLASMVIFGSTVLLILWLPIRIIHFMWPAFLPYHITLSSETPVSELSLELLLLQVILPALLEQGHTRVWLKVLIRQWCIVVSRLLGLRSYLLGDVPLNAEEGELIGNEVDVPPEGQPQAAPNGDIPNLQRREEVEQENPPPPEEVAVEDVAEDEDFEDVADELAGGLGAAHQALLQREGPTGYQPYIRPRWFGLRILCLIFILCCSLTAASVIFLTVPVWVGKKCMKLAFGEMTVHELYTIACGLYGCLWVVRTFIFVFSWFTLGWSQVLLKLQHWSIVTGKALIALILVAGVIPLMVGLLIELVIVTPFQVPLHQTPILFLWQDWALGVLYTKIVCAVVMMGPNWWLKTNLEQIYLGGVRNLNMKLVVRQTALPVIAALGVCLAGPYVAAKSVAPLFAPHHGLLLIERRIYPALLASSILGTIVVVQIMQFTRLYEHIKNDKYLVGKRLVNYYHSTQSRIIQREQLQQPLARPPPPPAGAPGLNQREEDPVAPEPVPPAVIEEPLNRNLLDEQQQQPDLVR